MVMLISQYGCYFHSLVLFLSRHLPAQARSLVSLMKTDQVSCLGLLQTCSVYRCCFTQQIHLQWHVHITKVKKFRLVIFFFIAQRIDFSADWKIITVHIGGNDLCIYCKDPVSSDTGYLQLCCQCRNTSREKSLHKGNMSYTWATVCFDRGCCWQYPDIKSYQQQSRMVLFTLAYSRIRTTALTTIFDHKQKRERKKCLTRLMW